MDPITSHWAWLKAQPPPRRRTCPGFILVPLVVFLAMSGCATSYKPRVTGPDPFSFEPTPEQCAHLLKERRTYRAVEKTAGYVAGAGALVSVLALGFVDAKVVPAVSSGVSLLAGGTLAFTGSQVDSLGEEINLGSCLNQPLPSLPTLSDSLAGRICSSEVREGCRFESGSALAP